MLFRFRSCHVFCFVSHEQNPKRCYTPRGGVFPEAVAFRFPWTTAFTSLAPLLLLRRSSMSMGRREARRLALAGIALALACLPTAHTAQGSDVVPPPTHRRALRESKHARARDVYWHMDSRVTKVGEGSTNAREIASKALRVMERLARSDSLVGEGEEPLVHAKVRRASFSPSPSTSVRLFWWSKRHACV